jgi:hypothetical protein
MCKSTGDFQRAADIRIYHCFGEGNGALTRLRKALSKLITRQGRFFLNSLYYLFIRPGRDFLPPGRQEQSIAHPDLLMRMLERGMLIRT